MEQIRSIVRPVVMLSGWLTLIGLVAYLVIKFANLDMAKMMLTFFLGVITGLMSYWFSERKKAQKGD